MLGQVKVKDKSNEITAIPQLLDLLDLTGCIVTIDAMGTQTQIAKKIVQQGGDYVLSLKGNHPNLLAQVSQCFEERKIQPDSPTEYRAQFSSIEASHYRLSDLVGHCQSLK